MDEPFLPRHHRVIWRLFLIPGWDGIRWRWGWHRVVERWAGVWEEQGFHDELCPSKPAGVDADAFR